MYGSPISPFHHNPGSPDIRRKFQKLWKGPETPISHLGKEANRVFLNRDQEEEAKREKKEAQKDRRPFGLRSKPWLNRLKSWPWFTLPLCESHRESKEEKRLLEIHHSWDVPSMPTAERMGIGKGSAHITLREGMWRPLHQIPLC